MKTTLTVENTIRKKDNMNKIDKFDGEYRFLSNFFLAPVTYDGRIWPSSEHAYQAMKTEDKTAQESIRHMKKPGEAKRAGKIVTLRPYWNGLRELTMLEIVRAKFSQNADLAAKLIATGDAELIEGNTWHDNFFGDCSCPRCKEVQGKNVLGKVLMQVRKELKEIQK